MAINSSAPFAVESTVSVSEAIKTCCIQKSKRILYAAFQCEITEWQQPQRHLRDPLKANPCFSQRKTFAPLAPTRNNAHVHLWSELDLWPLSHARIRKFPIPITVARSLLKMPTSKLFSMRVALRFRPYKILTIDTSAFEFQGRWNSCWCGRGYGYDLLTTWNSCISCICTTLFIRIHSRVTVTIVHPNVLKTLHHTIENSSDLLRIISNWR